MVSSIGFSLGANRRITGFGRRRVPVTRIGSGVGRRTIGAIARPALGWLANRISDAISGSGKRKTYRKRTVRGSSFKLSGAGLRRKTTYKKRTTTTRKPRKTLACGLRKRRVHRRVMF